MAGGCTLSTNGELKREIPAKTFLTEFIAGLPDVTVTVDDAIAEGDRAKYTDGVPTIPIPPREVKPAGNLRASWRGGEPV